MAPRRLLVGVLAALVALPFLAIIWYAINMVMIGLFVVDGPGWLAYTIYYVVTGFLVVLDLWIGYEAANLVR